MSTEGKRIRRWFTAEVYSERFFEDGNFAEFQTHGVRVGEFEVTVQRRRGGRWGSIKGSGYRLLAAPSFTAEVVWPSGERKPNIEYTGDYPDPLSVERMRRAREWYRATQTEERL